MIPLLTETAILISLKKCVGFGLLDELDLHKVSKMYFGD